MKEFLAFTCYLYPVFPLLSRAVLCGRQRQLMSDVVPEAAQERDVHRTFIFSLAGFSFTAVAGLAVLDGSLRIGLKLPTWYVFVSFVVFISSLNVQSYKVTRLHNQIATSLQEVGVLSLMLALIALLFTADFGSLYQWSGAALALGTWSIDHAIRWRIDDRFLSALLAKPQNAAQASLSGNSGLATSLQSTLGAPGNSPAAPNAATVQTSSNTQPKP